MGNVGLKKKMEKGSRISREQEKNVSPKCPALHFGNVKQEYLYDSLQY